MVSLSERLGCEHHQAEDQNNQDSHLILLVESLAWFNLSNRNRLSKKAPRKEQKVKTFWGQHVANHRAGEHQWWLMAIISDASPTAASDLRLPINP